KGFGVELAQVILLAELAVVGTAFLGQFGEGAHLIFEAGKVGLDVLECGHGCTTLNSITHTQGLMPTMWEAITIALIMVFLSNYCALTSQELGVAIPITPQVGSLKKCLS